MADGNTPEGPSDETAKVPNGSMLKKKSKLPSLNVQSGSGVHETITTSANSLKGAPPSQKPGDTSTELIIKKKLKVKDDLPPPTESPGDTNTTVLNKGNVLKTKPSIEPPGADADATTMLTKDSILKHGPDADDTTMLTKDSVLKMTPNENPGTDVKSTTTFVKRKKLQRAAPEAPESSDNADGTQPPSTEVPGIVDPMSMRDSDTSRLKRIKPQTSSMSTDSGLASLDDSLNTETVHLKVIKEKKKQLAGILSASQTIRLRPSAGDTGAPARRVEAMTLPNVVHSRLKPLTPTIRPVAPRCSSVRS